MFNIKKTTQDGEVLNIRKVYKMDNNVNLMKIDNNLEIWEGRYYVIAEVENYHLLDTLWTMRMYIYSQTLPAIDPPTRAAILESIPSKYTLQAYFTFSEKYADELVDYINQLKGFKAYKIQACKPNERLEFLRWIKVDTARGEGLHTFSEEDNYPFEFDAVGFFDINLAVRTGQLSEKQLWFEIERALEPLPFGKIDRLLQLSLEIVKENVDR